jgi:hypothetical protein
MSRREGEPGADSRKVDVVVPTATIDAVALEDVTVSNVDIDQQSLSFDVDKVGVPVLVRVSYFPNWNVSGAEGPYRVAPNMMVVIPTSNTVSMSFESSLVDHFAYLLTLVGIVVTIVIFRRDRRANRQVTAPVEAA